MSENKSATLTNELKIRKLRAAIAEGEASGPAVEFDMYEFLSSRRDNLLAEFTEWPSGADE